MPTPTAIAYTRPMTNNDHNARHDRLEDAILRMEATQRELAEGHQQLKAAALKHDVMLEMLQAIQRDQTRDIQEHEEMLKRHEEMLKRQEETLSRIVDMQARMFTIVEHITEIQQAQAQVQRDQAQVQRDQASAIQKHEETQEAMRVAIQTLSTILRRLTENGNDAAR